MAKAIICGTDAHDNSLVSQIGVDAGPAELVTTGNTVAGRKKLFAHLKRLAKAQEADRIVLFVVGTKGIRAHQLGKLAGLMSCRRASWSHFMQNDRHATARELPSRLGTGEPAADDMNRF